MAEIDFRRKAWTEEKQHVRVIAVRSRDRVNGKQVYLWEDLDYTDRRIMKAERSEKIEAGQLRGP